MDLDLNSWATPRSHGHLGMQVSLGERAPMEGGKALCPGSWEWLLRKQSAKSVPEDNWADGKPCNLNPKLG